MPESAVEQQLRLLLEQNAADLFNRLFVDPLRRYDLVVVVCDFESEFGQTGHVAFKTSHGRATLVATVEGVISSWSGGPVRFAPPGMSAELLRLLAEHAKEFLPAGVGFIVIVGGPQESAYVSNVERSTAKELIENDLLPQWRKGV